MASMLDRVLPSVLAQPVHVAAGLQCVQAAQGEAEIRYVVNDTTANPHGKLHGGIIALMHDVAVFLAVASLLPAEKHAVTAETHVSILRPANLGETIRVRARVDRLGRSLAFSRSETVAIEAAGRERLIATASLTKAVVDAAP